jgi:hypothetical protein
MSRGSTGVAARATAAPAVEQFPGQFVPESRRESSAVAAKLRDRGDGLRIDCTFKRSTTRHRETRLSNIFEETTASRVRAVYT